jgi:hypothetical protein
MGQAAHECRVLGPATHDHDLPDRRHGKRERAEVSGHSFNREGRQRGNPSRALFRVRQCSEPDDERRISLPSRRLAGTAGEMLQSSSSSCGTGIPAGGQPPSRIVSGPRGPPPDKLVRGRSPAVSKPVTALASIPAGSTVTLAIRPLKSPAVVGGKKNDG